MKLLLAEDEKELSRALEAILKHNGYEIKCVYNGAEALDALDKEDFDAYIFDIMMPVMDGIEALKEMRKRGIETPVLMLTAKSQVDDRIAGLDAGANDYLTKPFAAGELLARIRAMTRKNSAASKLFCGDLSLDRETHELMGKNTSFRLGNKEFEMLEIFMQSIGRTVTAKQLSEKIWDNKDDGAVYLYISYLNKKLEAAEAGVFLEKTNDGYILRKECA